MIEAEISDLINLIRFGKREFKMREFTLDRLLLTEIQSMFAAVGREGERSAQESSGMLRPSAPAAAGVVAAATAGAGAGAFEADAGADGGGAAFARFAAACPDILNFPKTIVFVFCLSQGSCLSNGPFPSLTSFECGEFTVSTSGGPHCVGCP